jgi:signal transduction histidine kinase
VSAARWVRAAEWGAATVVATVPLLTDLAGGVGMAMALGDGFVGAVFVLAAALSAGPRRQRVLVANVGLAWALGGFVPLAGLHRGALAHALLAFPDGRLVDWRRRIVVLVSYALALTTDSLSVAGGMFAIIALVALDRSPARLGLPRFYPGLAAAALGALVGGEAWRAAVGSPVAPSTATWVYEAVLVGVALGFLLAARAHRHGAPAGIEDVVVQLDPTGGLSWFTNALATLVGDPSLTVLEWDNLAAAYVDADGAPYTKSAPTDALLLVHREGQPFAAVTYKPGSLSGPGMARATETAVRLAVQHAQLRRQEQSQVDQLLASRQRLQVAADIQRARIEERLRLRVAKPAARLAAALRQGVTVDPVANGLLRSAEAELVAVAADISALTGGLRPPSLDGGLDVAVSELARRSALTVHVDNRVGVPLPRDVEAPAYFVCAETLANTAKHSGADAVHIVLETLDGCLRLTVRDDGVGGANLAKGTGLQGLADRVAALGGRLSLGSPAGGPTTVTVVLPFSADPEPGM